MVLPSVTPSNSKGESKVQQTKKRPSTDKQEGTWLGRAFSKSDLSKEECSNNPNANLDPDPNANPDPDPGLSQTASTRKLFNLYDEDGSHTITYDELKAALFLESPGEFTDAEFEQLIATSDDDNSGSVDLAEFQRLVAKFRVMQREKYPFKTTTSRRVELENRNVTCHHFLVNGLRMIFQVKVKWLLALVCVLVCVALAPALGLANNGMHPNDMAFGLTQSLIWIFLPWICLGHWVVAYPLRYRPAWVAVALALSLLCCIPLVWDFTCNGHVFRSAFDKNYVGSLTRRLLRVIGFALLSGSMYLGAAMYHGPVHHKWVYALASLVPLIPLLVGITWSGLLQDNALIMPLQSLWFAGLPVIYLATGIFGGHICCRKPKSTEGGQRAFIMLASVSLPGLTQALVRTFMVAWMALANAAALRTPFWLLWKFLCFWIIHLWAKIMCYSMTSDMLALVMMFGQIFALQFATELLFISVTPFTWQFFVILALKIALNVLAKGRLLEKLNTSLQRRIKNSKFHGTCAARALRFFIKGCVMTIQVFAANAGNRVVHLTPSNDHEVMEQDFITHVIYTEMSLLSSVICSIACTTLVGMEILLTRFFPDTFQHRVWTFRATGDPIFHLLGYLTVVTCNMLISIIVAWMLARDFCALQVVTRFKAGLATTGVLSNIEDVTANIKRSRDARLAGDRNLTEEQHKLHARQLVVSSFNVVLRQFHKAKTQLHVFEQTIFNRHQNFLYFMCFYLTISIIPLSGFQQHKFFLAECQYIGNFSYFSDVFNRVAIPEDPQCRFYTDDLNPNNTVNNHSTLHVVSNLTTIMETCTHSFKSVW